MFPMIPGRCRIDASFSLGVACGLVYLIGASKTEITKMVEVRKQMEMLLQNFREELQNKNSSFKSSEIEDCVAYSTNHIQESSNSSSQISLQMDSTWTTSLVIPESETILECDDSSRPVVHEREQPLTGMDELEAELEAELELLELHLDTERPLVLPEHQRLEVKKSTLRVLMLFTYGNSQTGHVNFINIVVVVMLIEK